MVTAEVEATEVQKLHVYPLNIFFNNDEKKTKKM